MKIERSTPVALKSKKFAAIDGLRAIAILLVLAAHMIPLGGTGNDVAGSMGMSLFFCLSGFLITTTLLHNPDLTEFMVRRCVRIMPLAYLYISLVFILFPMTLGEALAGYAFVVNYIGMGPYNWHFWSLAVEMQFYVSVALVVLCGGRRALWVVWPACLAVMLLRMNAGAYSDFRTHLRVDEILAGACVATIYKESWRGSLSRATLLALFVGVAWIATSMRGPLQYFRPCTTGLLLTVVLCHPETLLVRVLSSAPLRYVANVSYALYVVHPITYTGWMLEGGFVVKAIKRVVSFALTFGLAHLSTFYWEAPWRRTASQWLERRRDLISARRSANSL